MQRVRIHYYKGEALQYIGNLDLHKVWERTFRRAQIPLAYSQGFHPQPRMHQACPLPLGFTSRVELLDFWCKSDESLEDLRAKLERTVQPGIEIQTLTIVPLKSPALQTIVESSLYRVTLDDSADPTSVEKRVAELNASEHCLRERRGKQYDLRVLLKDLSFDPSRPPTITMRLSAMPGATGRPEEVLEELGISPFSVDVERIELTLMPYTEEAELPLEE
jgi:radical SAM-linked protein